MEKDVIWCSNFGEFEVADMPIHIQHYVTMLMRTQWWQYGRRRAIHDCIEAWCECDYQAN